MAFVITEECIGCDACRMVCPTGAVKENDPIYSIIAECCTECIVDHPEPQCLAVCPVDSIFKIDNLLETYEQLLEKRNRVFLDVV